jgi:hypothetical protein
MKTKKEIAKEITDLHARNAAISKAGGFFTGEQVANARNAWMLSIELRKLEGEL